MKKPSLFITVWLLSLNICIAQNADITLLHSINSNGSPGADKTFKFISNSMGPVAVAAPLTMFVTGFAAHDKELQKKSYITAASLLLSTGLTFGLKATVKRPRPFITYPNQIEKKSDAGGFSFPSGHTSAAFSTATSLSLAFPKWYVIAPSYAYACAVGYSRMYLGVHYPSDVLGGIIIGAGSSFLIYKGEKWINKK